MLVSQVLINNSFPLKRSLINILIRRTGTSFLAGCDLVRRVLGLTRWIHVEGKAMMYEWLDCQKPRVERRMKRI
jgi:hypothetical protein